MLPEHFIGELQTAQAHLGDDRFWIKHFGSSEATSFRQTLDLYAKYQSELTTEQQAQLASVFWSHIQNRQLPIIDMSADGKNAQVFFLFRKAKDNGRDLYLQGDVHGYGSTLDSQRLQRQGETDILCCENSIPKNALVTYQYVEVADDPDHPVYRNKMPNDEQLTGVFSNPFPDPYQKHAHPYYAAGFFCVNTDNDVSHLSSSPIDWPTLISGAQMHLVSGEGGVVSPFPYAVSDNYMGQLWGPECAEFRRTMHVFAPPGKLNQLVIINDGPGYLLVNTAERIAKLKQAGAISEQCAVVFVGTLPGLAKDHTLTSDLSKMQGMGIRTIDYLDHVDEYVEFLTGQLLPYLENNGIEIPHDPAKVTVIGSSMSGTASLYMGLRYPEHFGNVIAQSPSPANRQLIGNLDHLSDRARRINIDLSCGAFEDATQYAKIGNLEFMQSLEGPLGVKGHAGLHGHELHAWSPDLERSLPAVQALSPKNNTMIIAGATLPTTESGAIDLTRAKRIAEGGTHILYRFPEASFIVKVMKQNPKQDKLEELERKYAILYDCFDQDGKQRCIREQHVTLPILLPGKEPEAAALSIVPYEKCFDSIVKFDFKIDPAELDPYLMDHNVKLFDSINENLINGNAGSHFDVANYTTIDAKIGAILQRLDSDAELRVVIIEFLNHYRDFYQQTNIILDAFGRENILFFKDDNNDWQFKIGSAIKHDTGTYTNQLFADIHVGKAVDLSEFVNMTHAYFSPANIRAVNVCAMKLGLAPIIQDVAIDPRDLLTVSQRLSIPQRILAYARHGDFEKVESMLEKNKSQLNLNLSDSWVYPQIAYEYIHHGQAPSALKNYLDTVNTFPVVLPEKIDDQKWVKNSKMAIVDLKNTYDNKAMLHTELTAWLAEKMDAQQSVTSERSQPQPIISSSQHEYMRGTISIATTKIDYPRAMQNNMMTPPASTMNRAQGSTAIHITHHSLRESVVIAPAHNTKSTNKSNSF